MDSMTFFQVVANSLLARKCFEKTQLRLVLFVSTFLSFLLFLSSSSCHRCLDTGNPEACVGICYLFKLREMEDRQNGIVRKHKPFEEEVRSRHALYDTNDVAFYNDQNLNFLLLLPSLVFLKELLNRRIYEYNSFTFWNFLSC